MQKSISDLCADLSAGARVFGGASHLATFWQLAAAVFEAQAQGLLPSDNYTKRIASRLLAQVRPREGTPLEVSDRLAADLLFFCSHARAPESRHLAPRLAQLQQQAGAAGAQAADLLALAQLLHFDLYWLEAAAPLYEAALAMQPHHDALRWTLVDVYTNTSDVDAQERHLRALAARNPGDAFTSYYLRWFEQTYPR